YFGGRRDLEEGIIRVLYNLSFVEDPTRILRAVRFEQRYNFTIESQTLNLAKGAIKSKMLAKLSADRVREELKHILAESYPLGAIRRMQELGIWRYILPEAVLDDEVLALTGRLPGAMGFIWDLGMRDYEPWLIYLTGLLYKGRIDAAGLEARLRLTRDEQYKVMDSLCRWRSTLDELGAARPMKMSEIARILRNFTPEGYIFILAKAETDRVSERIKNYLARSRHNKLAVTGEDIKALGYRPGPLFKEVLDALVDARLDGLVQTREEELRFAGEYLAKRREQ
ncbi:MAG: polynucleotide adenylyltransferase, partial [Bacillota bacterium]